MRQIFLQNATAILLRNATKKLLQTSKWVWFLITKCNSYYKLGQFYYKIRQLLQNVTFITNWESTHFDELLTSFSKVYHGN